MLNLRFSFKFMMLLLKHLKSNPGSNIFLVYKGFSLKMIKTASHLYPDDGRKNTLKHIFHRNSFYYLKSLHILWS
jgi:hypothetical protein